ncbi:uncharacterized protein LOC133815598 [Humulus lupulus]|uniref:uncharacterized protein LOC133815598 n=1 Tax=Humulus lupulus TaxID=3486 RepID=UPI002B4018C6|nr:uncharacterized protein LOC133815598 [Humulus lupulus]
MTDIHDVDALTYLAAQVSSISNMLKTMNMAMNQSMGQPMGSQMGQMENISCVYYGEGHTFDNCPSNLAVVCYMGNQNRNGPYSNSYNPSWRQHPNFSWSNQGVGPNISSMPPTPTFPLGYPPQAPQQRPQQAVQSNSLENMLKECIVKNEAMIQSQATSMRNLETQVGQLANELRNRPQGVLPSDTENPRNVGNEHCKVVILRIGNGLENSKKFAGHEDEPSSIQNNEKVSEDAENSRKLASTQNAAASEPPQSSPEIQKLPFPQRFQKQKQESQFKRFLDMLKQLHINIPLVEALEKMSNYVKFMKDILTKKRQLGEIETMALTKKCSSFSQNKFPPKMKDPGSFTIPCTIGIGELRPTTVTLQLADRSLARPDGKIEDVLVKVHKFIFPIDFIVLDYEANREIPIILGLPFLATSRTLIDIQKGELTMRIQDEQVTFNVFKAMRFLDEVEECSVVSVVDSLASKELENSCLDDPLERLLSFDSQSNDMDEYLAWLEAKLSSRAFKAPRPSVEEPPELELKVLPSHLRYAYLGESSSLSVIVLAELAREQEDKLLEVLRNFKKVIGWTIADIKVISPSLCLHKILLEDSEKGSSDGQRRLNPIMKEVVKKAIIKWLDTDIIYPISDSSWMKKFLEVFMDDFSVFGDSYDDCLSNLAKILQRCEETNLVLNWKKCYFMVKEGIVLGHKASKHGIEVDRAKIEVIEKLPPPTSVKNIIIFLGHAGFYSRFIENFSKISNPFYNLLKKDTPFHFDEACVKAFEELKSRLVSAPIIVAPDWDLPFELMCDASAQLNYTVTEKELLAIVFAFDKFWSYLVGTKVIVYTDHSAVKYLIEKKEAKPRFIRCVLLLHEFDVEIQDRK